MRSGWRWVAVGLWLCSTACPKEEPAPPTPKAAASKPAEEPKRHKISFEPKHEVAAPLPGGDCTVPPSWRVLVPCAEDGYAYARGEAPQGINPSLARSQASQRARWALAQALDAVKDAHASLTGAEIPEVYACEGTIYALARIATEAEHLPGCGTTLRSHAVAPEGCPDWARGQAWIDGDHIVGVSIIDGVKSRALARSSALRRAKHAASEVISLELSTKGESVSGFTAQMLLTTLDSEVVECDGRVWGRVSIDKKPR